MAGMSVFDIAGRAMSAQLVRLNTTASNLANAGSVATKAEASNYPQVVVSVIPFGAKGLAGRNRV